VIGVFRECATILLIACERQEVDEPISNVGRARKIGGQKIADYLAAASADWILLRVGIGSEISELAGIDRVTDA
jgi:hypothetical protein